MLNELDYFVLCFGWLHFALIFLLTPIISLFFFREIKDETKKFSMKYMAVMFLIFLLSINSNSVECKDRGLLLVISSVLLLSGIISYGIFFLAKFLNR